MSAVPWPLHHLLDRQASSSQICGPKQSRGLAEDSTEPSAALSQGHLSFSHSAEETVGKGKCVFILKYCVSSSRTGAVTALHLRTLQLAP